MGWKWSLIHVSTQLDYIHINRNRYKYMYMSIIYRESLICEFRQRILSVKSRYKRQPLIFNNNLTTQLFTHTHYKTISISCWANAHHFWLFHLKQHWKCVIKWCLRSWVFISHTIFLDWYVMKISLLSTLSLHWVHYSVKHNNWILPLVSFTSLI